MLTTLGRKKGDQIAFESQMIVNLIFIIEHKRTSSDDTRRKKRERRSSSCMCI